MIGRGRGPGGSGPLLFVREVFEVYDDTRQNEDGKQSGTRRGPLQFIFEATVWYLTRRCQSNHGDFKFRDLYTRSKVNVVNIVYTVHTLANGAVNVLGT